MDYAEAQQWDQIPLSDLPKKGVDVTKTVYRTLGGAYNRTFGDGSSASSAADSVKDTAKAQTAQAKKAVSSGVVFVQRKAEEVKAKAEEVVEKAKSEGVTLSDDVKELVHKAEKALATDTPPESKPASTPETPTEPAPSSSSTKSVYTAALPLGFEPPPGYARPAPPKPAPKPPSAPPLPLVAPAVKELSASEPVIAQIASSIDGLATLLKDSPTSSAGAKDILDAAQIDLVKLGGRIEAIKKDEQAKLEAQLEEQARDYSLKLLQLEVDSQDKIDAQEEGYKAMLEDERQQILQLYRQKLATELETQSEIINQRLVSVLTFE